MCELCGICDVCVATLQRQAYASKGDEGASVRVKPEEKMVDKWNDWSSGSDDDWEGGGDDDGSAAVRLSLSVSQSLSLSPSLLSTTSTVYFLSSTYFSNLSLFFRCAHDRNSELEFLTRRFRCFTFNLLFYNSTYRCRRHLRR